MERVPRIAVLAVFIAAFALAAVPGTAQETTGSIVGSIASDTGEKLPGVRIEASGPLGKIYADTNVDGKYRFPRVAPGQYVLVARLDGFQDATSETLVVILGQSMTVDFTMYGDSFAEEIVVYSDQSVLDFKESQTATSIDKMEIDLLPRGRDFTSVVAFAAGTVDDNQAGGISIDGASGLENRYVIDGIDTTDPQIGDSAIPMRAEFMEEVQVKSAGYAAEFGGSTGGVINAVTRSGGNQFHGSIFADYESNDWNGGARSELEYSLVDDTAFSATYRKDEETRLDPGFSLSGPVVRDRAWFFGSYQPGIRNRKRTVDWISFPTQTYESDFTVDYTMANVTANIGGNLLLKAGLNSSPYETDGLLPNRDGRADLPDDSNYSPLGAKGERETYSMTGDWIANDNFVVSGRAGFYHTNVEDTGIPSFDLIHNYSTSSLSNYPTTFPEIPANIVQPPGWFSDNLQNADQKNIYERTAFGLDATWNVEAGGDHTIKLGVQTEEIYNDVQSGYNADRILYYWDRSYTTSSGESIRGEYGYFRLLNIAALGEVTTNNNAIFLQDTWSVRPNLTLNIGVRAEKEEVPNYGSSGPDPAIEFGFSDKIAPRLGFVYDVKNDAKWKVYGSYGVYYDVTKYEMPRGSFGGNKWVDFFYTFDNFDIFLNSPSGGCSTGSNTIAESPTCGAGQLIEVLDRRFNSVDPLFQQLIGAPGVDPNLKPMESWELQFGVDHQWSPTIQFGARVVHKQIVRAIEDVGFLFPGIGEVYVIANPGEGLVSQPDANGLSFPKAEREYDALELTMNKRMSDNWSLRAYYTLSRLWGNYSGLANSDEQNNFGNPLNAAGTSARLSPNVSRLFDTVTSMYDANGNYVYGKLATNRTHQLGGQLLYNTPGGLSVGVTQYIGSGTPRSEIATVPIHSFVYPNGRGTLGETSWLTQTDVSLWQRWDISEYAISVGLSVQNIWDQDTVLRYWGTRNLQDLAVTDADFASGGFDYEAALAALGPGGLDPAFNLPDTYQAPREVRLSLRFEF